MLQKPMQGTVRAKRKQWCRKHIHRQEVHFSIKKQKRQFQRCLRNGKYAELPVKGNAYRKVADRDAKWKYVS